MPSGNDVLSLPDRELRELDVEVLRAHEDIGEVIPVHAPFEGGVKRYRSVVLQLRERYYGLHCDESEDRWVVTTEGGDREAVLAEHESLLDDDPNGAKER